MNKYMKPLLFLVALILIVTAISKVFGNSETLDEYAAKRAESKAETISAQETSAILETETQPSGEPLEMTTVPESEADSTNQEPTTVSESETDSFKEEDAALSFYYEPLSEEIINKITGISYVENEHITLDELRYVHLLHYNFDGEVTEGELICNEAIAQDLLEIFYELYQAEYQIESVKLIDEYNGDDTASMEANNTSCFNYRVVDGTTKLSKHAYGLAIDINPFYNPYMVFQSDGSTYISPKGSEAYADRNSDFPHKIDENDLCYKLFTEHGFTWGGTWNSCKDYQHFQKAD